MTSYFWRGRGRLEGHPRRVARAPWLALAALVPAIGCSPAGSHREAGPLESSILDTLPRVRLATEPLFTIGAAPESDEYAFVHVKWAAISGDSLLILGDLMAGRVGSYGFDGRFRRWIGRVGDGPGEFRQPIQGGVTSSGNVWISDHRRVLIYRPDGEVLETIVLREPDLGWNPTVLGVDSERGVWVKGVDRLAGGLTSSALEPVAFGERYRTRATIHRVRSNSSELVWSGDGNEEVYDRGQQGGVESRSSILAPWLLTALLGDGLVMTRTEDSSIQLLTAEGVVGDWLDYSAPDVAVGDRYPAIEGPDRYESLRKSLAFTPGDPGSTWLSIQHPVRPYDSLPPHLHLTAEGAIEYFDDQYFDEQRRRLFPPLFIGDKYSVWMGFTEFEEQTFSVYELVR